MGDKMKKLFLALLVFITVFFIYFFNINNKIEISENIKAIFYDKNVKNIFKEESYIKWIDNYELDNNSYIILKISDENYDVITIPK